MTTAAQHLATLSDAVRNAPPGQLASHLLGVLSEAVSPDYRAAAGVVIDHRGLVSDPLGVIISTPPPEGRTNDPVDIDTVGVVIEVVEDLTDETLRDAYRRVASAKALEKRDQKDVVGCQTSGTYGLLIARSSRMAFEDISAVLVELNANTPGIQWLNLICVPEIGLIEYCAQFAGHPKLGAWLPLPAGGFGGDIPPVSLLMVRTPLGAQSISRFFNLLILFLSLFRTTTRLPMDLAAQDSGPGLTLPSKVYQYGPDGELHDAGATPVRLEMEPDLQITDQAGKPMASIRYIPWQGRGVVILSGKFPLQPILLFSDAGRKASILSPAPGLQVSHLMDMSEIEFHHMLSEFAGRSNLQVKRASQSWVVHKISDEGTSNPYVARLMLGILNFRDVVMADGFNDRFDSRFEPLSQSLASVREATRALDTLWREHETAVLSGAAVQRTPGTTRITQSADRDLRRECETLLNAGVRLLKQNMQTLALELGVGLGFLFMKQNAFAAGLTKLAQTDPVLADYLSEARTDWTERLVLARNAIEHEGWSLPRVTYDAGPAVVRPREPVVAGSPVTQFADEMCDRLCCFVEDVTCHLLRNRFPDAFDLTEISEAERDPVNPQRFKVTLKRGGRPPWTPVYAKNSFLTR